MDIEAELLKTMSKEEMNTAAAKLIADFHGFLTRDVALKIMAAEKGILKKDVTTIAEIKPAVKNITLTCSIVTIGQLKSYPTGNRCRVMKVEDETGTTEVLLWNEDAEEAAGFKSGDQLEIVNAYEKSGKLSLGYSGYFKIVKRAGFTDLAAVQQAEGRRIHVRSFISRVIGPEAAGFAFAISDGATEVKCLLPAGDERSTKLAQDRETVIENGLVKDNIVLIDQGSRLLLKRDKVAVGKLELLEADADGAAAVVGGTRIHLGRQAAFKLLGIKPNTAVQLSTIINLKRNMMLGRNVVLDLKGDDNVNNAKGG